MPTGELHPLLTRQLRRLKLDGGAAPDATAFALLLQRISSAYAESEQDRYLLERSQDISSREMAELNQALQTSQARLTSLLSLSSDWVWEQDAEGRFTFVSEELLERTGVACEALLGFGFGDDSPLSVELHELTQLQKAQAERVPFRHITFDVRGADGTMHHMRINGEPALDGGDFVGWRGVGSDVTAAVVAERRIGELARFDTLTGLPNRHHFLELLERQLQRARQGDRSFALFFIDLDRFKWVNDNLGHAAGDQLLRTVTRRLLRLLREGDVLARLGGDEFVVVAETLCDGDTLSKIASRLVAAAAEPMTIDGQRVQVSASIGVGVYPHDGADGDTLLRAADHAMYQAKAAGKNTFAFHTRELSQRARHHFSLEGDLRLAAEHGQLVLHYQPQVNAMTGEIVGMEALLRWRHPEHGLLMPASFIELAEESGLIVGLGRWALNQACAQLAAWRAMGLEPPPCAVNVSRRQLEDESLVDDVRSALAQHALEPRLLRVEVTENLLMADTMTSQVVLEALKELGVELSLDDFGTGHSSLAYLKRFPISELKIDRSFVMGLPDSVEDVAITRAVVAMAHSLGLKVVAEGVETPAQHQMLRLMGCDELQGHLFGRPTDALELETLLSVGRDAPPAANVA